jgi:biopolymer transport protein ExbB/TolQ
MARVAALVDRELRHGLAGLATVAATAPFLGMFGTAMGMVGCFTGGTGEKSTIMAALASGLCHAMAPAALGLLVAVPALAGYLSLRRRVEIFDVEMENASLELVNCLCSQRTMLK